MTNRLKMAKVQAIVGLHEKGWRNRRIARELDVDRGRINGSGVFVRGRVALRDRVNRSPCASLLAKQYQVAIACPPHHAPHSHYGPESVSSFAFTRAPLGDAYHDDTPEADDPGDDPDGDPAGELPGKPDFGGVTTSAESMGSELR